MANMSVPMNELIRLTEIPIDLHGNTKVRIYFRDRTRQTLLMFLQGVQVSITILIH